MMIRFGLGKYINHGRGRSYCLIRGVSSLVLIEQHNGRLVLPSTCAITAASKLGGPVTALTSGKNAKEIAKQVALFKGVNRVLYVENEVYDKGLADNFAPLVVENVKKHNFTHILARHSSFGRDILPRVSAILDKPQVSDIISIESTDTFVRPIYAGNAIAKVKLNDDIKIITVRGTAFTSPDEVNSKQQGQIEAGYDVKLTSKVKWVNEEVLKTERPDLSTAQRVVSGGRGLKSKEEFERLILPLADVLGAAVGASRAAVDSGFADNSLQVGQTGKTVAPNLYISVGISGAIQHISGMKDSRVIVSINKDSDAPIFKYADIGLIGDLTKIVPELTEKLRNN